MTMTSMTLKNLRDYIEALASQDGEYYLVCGRYGDYPVPAAGLRFERQATARAAAPATKRYREDLRQYDSKLPYYDIIVCEEADQSVDGHSGCATEADKWAFADPVVTDGPTVEGEQLIEFCHRIVGAVFEALSKGGHEEIEDVLRSPWTVSAETGTKQIVVEMSGYALSPRRNRLPILPIIVDCFGRGLKRAPTATDVERTDGGWELTFVFGEDTVSEGIASAPIHP